MMRRTSSLVLVLALVSWAGDSRAEGGPTRIAVFGDSMAQGLWFGLSRTLADSPGVHVANHSKMATGLAMPKYFDWPDEARDIVKKDEIDLAVVLLGANDPQTIEQDGHWYRFGTDSWRDVYAARVDALVGALQGGAKRVVWVGLPEMRHSYQAKQAAALNSIYAERCRAHGALFVPTIAWSAGELPDQWIDHIRAPGKDPSLRHKDGVHFTVTGYDEMAKFVVGVVLPNGS